MVYRATVTRITAAGPYVLAARLSPGAELGPCLAAQTPTALTVGDTVLVAFLDGSVDEVAVIARVP